MARTPASVSPARPVIFVRGAREHNLKGIDVAIPRDKLVVVTGLSGSGKSSLAFDTIYAEGQRRYVESLSAYARQFLQLNQKPDVEHIDGLSPAIAIEQKSVAKNPRSTVGTLTEIYDYLRLLYARIGVPYCYGCGKPIRAQTVQQMVDTVLALPAGTRFMILAPVVRGKKGEYRRELADWARQGFVRILVDGQMRELGEEIKLDKQKKHNLELVIDRLVQKPDIKQRLTDAVELALKMADGLMQLSIVSKEGEQIEERIFSERFSCEECGISYPAIEPRTFSFNSPFGACPVCDGLGRAMEFDPERIVPDPLKSIGEGAIAPWNSRAGVGGYYRSLAEQLAEAFGVDPELPWRKLPKRFRNTVLFGSGNKEIDFSFESDKGSVWAFKRAFEGVVPQLTRKIKETDNEKLREELTRYMAQRPCHGCGGARLKKEALHIKVGGASIWELVQKNINAALEFVVNLELGERDRAIAAPIVKEVRERLSFLLGVGLEYLNLERSAATLSGGEAQRIRLATQIGSALRGVIYVLDEPSIGLHQRDNARLLRTLERLRDLGNTVLVVEHDEDTIRAADYVIDMGPGAGRHGGEVVAEGSVQEILAQAKSLTADYLSGRRGVAVPEERRLGRDEAVVIRRARGNNLKGIDVSFPLGKLICVTGVSGSGKSTLVNDTLYAGLAKALGEGANLEAAPLDRIEGTEHIDKVIDIDQSPIGRTPRSNPATYTGLFQLVRDLFAGLPESRVRGYGPGRYSFNVKGGRCEACEGDGLIRIEMHFLPDVYVTCEECKGLRYNRETLEVRYRGKNIAEVLEMTVDEALEFLSAIPSIKKKLETLQAVGLGYIHLGQSATTLSGGEAQRVKLSRELSKRATGRTFYILDEPTTGLHFYDVERLLQVLHQLVDAGNTVVVIEHNLDVVKTADWLIDLGPEGGDAGGTVVGEGTPEDIAAMANSYTGQFLRPLLQGRAREKKRKRG